jgi:hypothetical protein
VSLKQVFANWIYNMVMEQHQQAEYVPCRWCHGPVFKGNAYCSACGWQQQAPTGSMQRIPLQLPAGPGQQQQQHTEEMQRMAEAPTRHMLAAVKPVQPVKSYPGQRWATYRHQRKQGNQGR